MIVCEPIRTDLKEVRFKKKSEYKIISTEIHAMDGIWRYYGYFASVGIGILSNWCVGKMPDSSLAAQFWLNWYLNLMNMAFV